MSWQLLSRIVVRRTGFPFELLERLSVADLAAATEAAGRDELAVTTASRTALAAFPAAVEQARAAGDRAMLRRLSRLRRAVATGALDDQRLAAHRASLPPHLVTLLEQLTTALHTTATSNAKLRQALAGATPRLTAALQETVTDPLFQEAVFLSNPDLYTTSLAPLARQAKRPVSAQLARASWAYLQRFSGKNDTASFFGPLNYASIVPDPAPPVALDTAPGRYRRRQTFLSYWAVKELAARIADDPAVRCWLRPRRHPMARPTKPGSAVPAGLTEVAQAVDGERTTAEIADKLGLRLEDVTAAVDELVRARVLVATIEVPSTRFQPFDSLREQVDALDVRCTRRGYWQQRLAEGEQLRASLDQASFADRPALVAALDQWFTEVTGQLPRRGQGKTYADRTLFYEDCEGTHERFALSQSFADDLLERLRPVLDLSAAHGSLLARHYQRLGREALDELSPAGRPVSYLRFAAHMLAKERAGALPATGEEVEQLRQRLTELVLTRSDGRVARLSEADVADLVTDVPRLENCHVSPDVMFSAPDPAALAAGNYQLVLGEVHQVVYAWGSQLYFDDRREQTERECAEHVGRMPEYARMAIVLTERQHKGLLHEVFPGTFIEATVAGPDRARERVAIADLQVVADGTGVALRHRATGDCYRLYMAGDEQLHLWAFALPRVMPIAVSLPDGHTPRIVIGGTVYQRERWRMPVSTWGTDLASLDDAGLLARAAAVRAAHGLPRTTYLHVASEPKPYYVDFLAPLALRTLQHLARSNDQLTFTEMVPGPEGLWLRESAGRYCCELRMTAFRY